MNRKFLRYLTAATLGAWSLAYSFAGTYTTTSGASYDGEIQKIIENQVTIHAGGENVEVALADFDAASSAAIKTWADAHPEAVDVYTKWDAQPRIMSSVMPVLPEQFHNPDFKGMVSVDLVLDEQGKVIHAAVKKSTHADLESPSLEAAKTWIFEPAQVGGKPVKSKLRVPFKFVYTPSEPTPAG